MRMLIVEDEKDLCNILKKRLQKDYTIDICMDGEIAKDYLNTYTYDIILLDIMLPKIDGITLLKWLRNQKKTTPVLLLTAKSSIEERVNGLDSGADDYLIKPFAFEELQARLRVLLRRNIAADPSDILIYEDLVMDTKKKKVSRNIGQRLEPVCIMCGTFFNGPLFHLMGDNLSHMWFKVLAFKKRILEFSINLLW